MFMIVIIVPTLQAEKKKCGSETRMLPQKEAAGFEASGVLLFGTGSHVVQASLKVST